MREQLAATIDAARRLVTAHVELAQAEMAEIGGEIARAAALSGLAIALLLLAGILLVLGLFLFFGEWLFGSIGWGVLYGVLFLTGIAVAAVVTIVGFGSRTVRWLAVSVVIGIVVGVVFGLELPNQAYASVGNSVATNVDPAYRPLVVGAALWALIGAILGLLSGVRAGLGRAIGGLVLGLLLGALFGAFTAITFGRQVGAALGVVAAEVAWIALMALDVARTGIDTEALTARFYPDVTIETAKETLEWAKRRLPPGIGS